MNNQLKAYNLKNGNIIGSFSKRAEFGQRALGNRSILASINYPGIVDKINQKMGRDKVQILGQGIAKRWVLKRERLSPSYTTRWDELLKVHC